MTFRLTYALQGMAAVSHDASSVSPWSRWRPKDIRFAGQSACSMSALAAVQPCACQWQTSTPAPRTVPGCPSVRRFIRRRAVHLHWVEQEAALDHLTGCAESPSAAPPGSPSTGQLDELRARRPPAGPVQASAPPALAGPSVLLVQLVQDPAAKRAAATWTELTRRSQGAEALHAQHGSLSVHVFSEWEHILPTPGRPPSQSTRVFPSSSLPASLRSGGDHRQE